MSNMLDHVAYLSQTIGPRPAGTEEEQQAAFYIADQLQTDAGLAASVEDFDGTGGANAARVACSVITLLATVLSMVLSFLALPAMIVTIVSALLFVSEVTGKPILSKMFRRGVSQNVVARFEPTYSAEKGGTRRRKIVLVAHYDSGKTQSQLNGPLLGMQEKLKKASFVGMVAVPVFLLVKNVFFLHAEGATFVVITVLLCLALLGSILPLLGALATKAAAYNEAANCNASGVAVLLEVAARVAQGGPAPMGEFSHEPRVHGEVAAREADLVPEGTELVYEAPQAEVAPVAAEPNVAVDPNSPEARLLAAKAAVAALTGRPVSTTISTMAASAPVQESAASTADAADGSSDDALAGFDVFADSFVPSSDGAAASVEVVEFESEALAAEELPVVEDDVVEGFSNAPDWFKKAQAKAKKPAEAAPSAYRSRYADALDSAVRESSSHFENAYRAADLSVEQRLQQVRESIMEDKAPELDREALASQLAAATVPAAVASVAVLSDVEAPAAVQPVQVSVQRAANPAPRRDLFIPSLVLQQQAAEEGATQSMQPVDVTELRAQIAQQAKPEPVVEPVVPVVPAVQAVPEFQAASAAAPRNVLASLPSIDPKSSDSEAKKNLPSLSLPSLSGTMFNHPGSETVNEAEVSSSGMPKADVPLTGSTMAFAPVTEELISAADPDDLYVDDAEDYGYEAGYGDTSSFAAPDYVEMPKSRLQRFFGRFGKKKEPEMSTREWLNVDEDFDARSVGAARGSWESFRSEEFESFNDDDFYNEESDNTSSGRGWNGGMYSYDGMDGEESYENAFDQIKNFYYGDINTEVWFVALGAELSGNNGMRAFLREHAQELRGSVIIELEGLGAGETCLVDSEGAYIPAKTSSRMKRYARKAAAAAGISLGSASLLWKDSAASYAIKQGEQAMHIVGMDGMKPALYAQSDDVMENVDEETLLQNADFVMELLKNI